MAQEIIDEFPYTKDPNGVTGYVSLSMFYFIKHL